MFRERHEITARLRPSDHTQHPLQADYDKLSGLLRQLQQDKIRENRSEELFRLDGEIAKVQAKRAAIEAELERLEAGETRPRPAMEKPAKKPRRRLALAGLLLLLAGSAGLFWQEKLVAWIYGPESGVYSVTLHGECKISIADDLVVRACHSQRADGSLLCEKETLQAALKICPEHPEANNNLADLLEREGELEQAVKYYQIALKAADNQFPEAWYGLGRTYGKQQQPALSLYAYVHACAAKPEARAAVKALVAVPLSNPAQQAEVDKLLPGCF